MSYIKSIDIVYNEMTRQNIRYWQVFDQNKTDLIAESEDSENLTVPDSIEHLREIVSELQGLVYVIIRKDGAAAKRRASTTAGTAGGDMYKGIYKYQVMLGEDHKTQNNGFSGASGNMFQSLLAMQAENFKLQLQHMQDKAELSKSFEEKLREFERKLEKGSDSPINDEMVQKGLLLLDKLLLKK